MIFDWMQKYVCSQLRSALYCATEDSVGEFLAHVHVLMSSDEPRVKSEPTAVEGRVARVKVDGMLVPKLNPILSAWKEMGLQVSGYREIGNEIRAALKDPNIDAIQLDIDSPGGYVAGLEPVARLIAESTKPITSMVSGEACSAAYWLASQTKSIAAEPGSDIGSIGAFIAIDDTSKAHADAGIDVKVFRSGPLKGIGVTGAPITDAQCAHLQASVDETAAKFSAAVARGRDQTDVTVAEWSTGRTWDAHEALKMGLIDRIFDDSVTSHSEVSASGVDSMEGNQAEIDAIRAENAALKAQLASNENARKETALNTAVAQGRVAPAARETCANIASKLTATEFETYLATVHGSSVTRPDSLGSSEAPALQDTPSQECAEVASIFGIRASDISAASKIKGISFDGRLVLLDGRSVDSTKEIK